MYIAFTTAFNAHLLSGDKNLLSQNLRTKKIQAYKQAFKHMYVKHLQHFYPADILTHTHTHTTQGGSFSQTGLQLQDILLLLSRIFFPSRCRPLYLFIAIIISIKLEEKK